MALIIQIDTANQSASIALAQDGNVVDEAFNHNQKDHASFVQPAIVELLKKNNLSLKDVDAVSVISGPGSYTGLRVGMASAKGLCYALSIPLIKINTLEAMAMAAIIANEDRVMDSYSKPLAFCPMIDARRNEVFAAIYDERLNIILEPVAIELNDSSLSDYIEKKQIVFSGNGAPKFKKMLQHQNLYLLDIDTNNHASANLGELAYGRKSFADVAYAEPDYLKNFYMPPVKRN